MPRFGRRNDEFEEFGESNEEVDMIYSDSALMSEEDESETFNGYPMEEDYDPYSNYLHAAGHGAPKHGPFDFDRAHGSNAEKPASKLSYMHNGYDYLV